MIQPAAAGWNSTTDQWPRPEGLARVPRGPGRKDTTKWCLMSVHSGTLTSRSVHPASPVLLTKNGPLVTVHSNVHVQLSNKDFLHI